MQTKVVEFNFPNRKEPARLELGNGNWVDVHAVETGAMRERYWESMYGGKKISAATEIEPGAALKANFLTRVVNWNLEFDGEIIPCDPKNLLQSFEQIPWALVEEINTFCNELDAKYKKKQGTDNPQN